MILDNYGHQAKRQKPIDLAGAHQTARLNEIRAKVVCWEYGVRRLLRPQPPGSLLPPIRDATHGKQVEGVFSLLKRSYWGTTWR